MRIKDFSWKDSVRSGHHNFKCQVRMWDVFMKNRGNNDFKGNNDFREAGLGKCNFQQWLWEQTKNQL